MSQARNYITIDSVINDYIDESEQSVHKYAKLYNIAVRGMEKLGLDFFYKIRTVKIPIDTTNYTVNISNIRDSYRETERARFDVGIRPMYPNRSYATSSYYFTHNVLPSASYYSIKDAVTNETIMISPCGSCKGHRLVETKPTYAWEAN